MDISRLKGYEKVHPDQYTYAGEVERIKKIAKLSKGKVLDIGYHHRPNPFLKEVYGIDLENPIKPYNYKETKKIDLNKQKIPYKDGFFDTVVLAETLEHIANLDNALSEVKRVLKKNGRIIISIPNPLYYMEFLTSFFSSVNQEKIKVEKGLGHMHSFTHIDILSVMKKYGFKFIERFGTYLQFIYFKPQWSINWPKLTKHTIYFCKKK